MGDKILKKPILLLTLSSCLLIAQGKIEQKQFSELSWVDEQIEAIKPPRKGVSYRAISGLRDPFIFLEKNKTKKKKVQKSAVPGVVPKSSTAAIKSTQSKKKTTHKNLKLQAVLNNSALINGRWYKLGQSVWGYKIIKVTLSEVTLKKEGRKPIVLTTYTKQFKHKTDKTKTK